MDYVKKTCLLIISSVFLPSAIMASPDATLSNNIIKKQISSIKNFHADKIAIKTNKSDAQNITDQQSNPHADAIFQSAQNYAKAEQYQKALDEVNQALLLDPNNISYLKLKATLESWLGNIAEAKKINEKILTLNPNDFFAKESLFLLNSPPYAAHFNETSATTFAALVSRGQAAEGKGQWQDAIAIYQSVLKLQPQRVDLWLRIAGIQNHIQQPQAAVQTLEQAIRIFPKDPSLNITLSQLYASENQPSAALATANRAVALEPNNINYLRARGQLASWAGRLNESIESYQRILKLNPNDQNAKDALAQLKLRQVATGGGPLDMYSQGLRAEGEKRWQDAIKIYQTLLQQQPTRIDLWLRIADIQIYLKQFSAAAKSTLKAISLQPNNAVLYVKLSQIYAANQQPQQALAAIHQAVILQPNNLSYLLTQGQLASWAGNYQLAEASFKTILAISPYHKEALLEFARLASAKNHIDEAAVLYRYFLQLYPDSAAAWIEYATVLSWQGDYPWSLKALESYRVRFGETKEYLAKKARVLANAGFWKSGMPIITNLLATDPHNYDYLYTLALMQFYANQPSASLNTLNELMYLRPQSPETKDLATFLITPIRSNANIGTYHFESTDTVNIDRNFASGTYFLNPETSFSIGGRSEKVSANPQAGIGTIQGNSGIKDTVGWLGFYHLFSPYFSLLANVGPGNIESTKNFLYYNINGAFQLTQQSRLQIQEINDVYAVSPLAMSLGVTQHINRVQLNLEPQIQKYLFVNAEYDTFSDSNAMKSLTVSPSIGAVRTQWLNIDVGVSGNWLGFSKDLSDGYYDPSFYQAYLTTAKVYIKQSSNIGYLIEADMGPQKDETFDHFRYRGDISGSAFFGIYKDWLLVISGAKAIRQSAGSIVNPGGTYQAKYITATLTRRF